MSRRTKWKGLQNILQSSQLDRPAFFLLMALVQETNPGETLSQQEMEMELLDFVRGVISMDAGNGTLAEIEGNPL